MDEFRSTGFNHEQVIIFKLGQIESTLESIQAQLHANEVRDSEDRGTVNARLDAHDTEIKELQQHKNYFAGVMLVAGIVLMAAKELIFKWLNFH